MVKEVLTKLSDNDLAQVCGGQIYAATEGNTTRWYVPTPPGNKLTYSGYFATERGAVEYAEQQGLWMDITHCDNYRQANSAAAAYGTWYYDVSGYVPGEFNPRKWKEQRDELIYGNKVSPFSY